MTSNSPDRDDINTNMDCLRLQDKVYDVKIVVGEQHFMSHKEVLCSKMKFFRRILQTDNAECAQSTVRLDPQVVDPTIFGEILHYLHSSEISLKVEKLQPVYGIAQYLCYDDLRNAAKNHMRANMNIDDLLVYLNIAKEYRLKSLEDEFREFIIANPLTIGGRQLIAWLCYEQVQSLLNKLNALSRQEEMFHYSIEWIQGDPDHRRGKLPKLLRTIPLDCLSLQFLRKVVSNSTLVLNNKECLKLLVFAYKNKRQSSNIYVIGGSDHRSESLPTVLEFDSRDRQWHEVNALPGGRSHFACVTIEQKIYIAGGLGGSLEFGQRDMNDLDVLETYNGQYKSLKPMKYPRHQCSMAALDGYLYVAGGLCGVEHMASVERYSIEMNDWEVVSPMATKRKGHELIALNGYLYAIGGQEDERWLKTVERYDPAVDKWTFVCSTNRDSFHDFGCVTFGGRIYVANGKCEVYRPDEDSWHKMAAPKESRFGFKLAVFEGRLLAIGGVFAKVIEYYDFEEASWRPTNDPNVECIFYGMAVVNQE